MANDIQEQAQVEEPVVTETTTDASAQETTSVTDSEEQAPQETSSQEDSTEETIAEPEDWKKSLEVEKAERELLQNKNKELESSLAELEKQKQVMQKRVDDNVSFNERVKEELNNQSLLVKELAEQRDIYKSKTYEALRSFQSGELDHEEYLKKLSSLDGEMEGRISDLQERLAASHAHNKVLEASKIAGLDETDRKELEKIISSQPTVWFQKASYNEPEDLALLIERVLKPIREKRVAEQAPSNEVSELKKQIEELKNLIVSTQSQPAKPKIDKPVIKGGSGATASETQKSKVKSDYPLIF